MYFTKLGMAAGNSSMANTLDPFIMPLPLLMRNATHAVDAFAYDIKTVEPDTSYVLTTNSTYANHNLTQLLTAGANNSPVLQPLTTSEATNAYQVSFEEYHDPDYGNLGFIRSGKRFDFGTNTAFPNAVDSNKTTVSYMEYTQAEATGTPNMTTLPVCVTNDSGGKDTYFMYYGATAYSDKNGTVVQKDTDGERQWAVVLYTNGTARIGYRVIPLPDGSSIIGLNSCIVKLSSTGTVVWSKSFIMEVHQYRHVVFDDSYTYMYDIEDSQLRRITLATGEEAYRSLSSAFSSIKTSGNGYLVSTSATDNRRIAKDGNGNFWVLMKSGGISDTVACFDQDWNFIGKYTFEQTIETSYRSYLHGIAADGDNIMLVGSTVRNSASPYLNCTFVSKLACDGTSTGVANISNSVEYGAREVLNIQYSTTQGGTVPSWTLYTPTNVSISRQTYATYDIKDTLTTGTSITTKDAQSPTKL